MLTLSRRQLFASGAAGAFLFAEGAGVAQYGTKLAPTTPLQRLLLEKYVYEDPASYVAFVAALASPTARPATYRAKLAELDGLTASDRVGRLASAIGSNVFFDCTLNVAGATQASPQELVDVLVSRSGFALALGREVGPLFGLGQDRGPTLLPNVVQLIQASTGGEFHAFSADSANGLKGLLTAGGSEEGVLGLLSRATGMLHGLSGNASAFAELTDNVEGLAKNLSTFTDSISNGRVPDPASLKGAVGALGNLLHVPPQTVGKINKVLDTASAVVAGAVAGAAFGGVGAVVGGAVGLLVSLFSNSEPQRNPTLDALAIIDQKLDVIRQDVASLSVQVATMQAAVLRGLQNIDDRLQGVQHTLQEMQARSNTQYTLLLRAIVALEQGTIVSSFDQLRDRVLLDDEAYRNARIDPAVQKPDVSQVLLACTAIETHISGAGIGFSHPGRIGFDTLASVADALGKAMATTKDGNGNAIALPLSASFQYTKALTGAGGFSFMAVADPQLASQIIASAAQDPNCSASLAPIGLSGEACGQIVADVQAVTVAALDGFQRSSEWGRLSLEERQVQAGEAAGGAWKPIRGVPPMLPADLAWVTARFLEIVSQSTHSSAVTLILAKMLPILRQRLACQSVLVDPACCNALLYARRRLAKEFVSSAGQLMANPLLRAVNVLRRAMRTALSARLAYGPRHNTDPLSSSTETATRIDNPPLQDSPLLAVSGATFQAWPEVAEVQRAAIGFFSLPESMRSQALALTGYVAQVSLDLGRQLAKGHSREWPTLGVSSRIRSLAQHGLAIATLDSLIQSRLDMSTAAGIQVPAVRWLAQPLDEYTRLFTRALGETVPQGLTQDETHGAFLIRALLDCPGVDVLVPDRLDGTSKVWPFPHEIGYIWGWGAESLALDTPDAPVLAQVLTRSEAFLAVRNDATLQASANYQSLSAIGRDLELGPEIFKKLQTTVLKAGLRKTLERMLA